jgi:hypothetical protein
MKFLLPAQFETKDVGYINQAFAVDAPTLKKAKELVCVHIATCYGGKVTSFSRSSDIEKLNLRRYYYKAWEYVNFDVSAFKGRKDVYENDF